MLLGLWESRATSLTVLAAESGNGDAFAELMHNPAVLMMVFTFVLVGFIMVMNRITGH